MYENKFSFCIKTPTKRDYSRYINICTPCILYMKRNMFVLSNELLHFHENAVRTSTQVFMYTRNKILNEIRKMYRLLITIFSNFMMSTMRITFKFFFFSLERKCGTEWVDYVVLVCWSSIRLICLLIKLMTFFKLLLIEKNEAQSILKTVRFVYL